MTEHQKLLKDILKANSIKKRERIHKQVQEMVVNHTTEIMTTIGMYQSLLEDYNKLVDQYNELLVAANLYSQEPS